MFVFLFFFGVQLILQIVTKNLISFFSMKYLSYVRKTILKGKGHYLNLPQNLNTDKQNWNRFHQINQIKWIPALVNPSKVWNWWGNREPVSVVDVFEAELLEHLTWFEIVVNDACRDVLVLLGQSLRHDLHDQWAKSTTLEALIDLQRSEWSHLDSQAPCDEFVIFLRESTNIQVHFDQSLDEVQRTIVLVRPQIINLLALLRNQLLQIYSIRRTGYVKLESLFLRHVVEVEHEWVHNR